VLISKWRWRLNHRQSKWFFALTYLIAIPSFAAIYSAMPNDFYHSTVAYEQSIADDERRVLRQIRLELIDSYLRIHKTPAEKTRELARQASFELINLHYENGSYTVTMRGRDHYSFPDQRFVLREQEAIGFEFATAYYFAGEDVRGEPLWPLDGYIALAIGTNRRPETEPDALLLYLPRAVQMPLAAWRRAQAGFPGASSGRYWRMLYVSSITITTVGYGDIVPLTNRARLIIAAEAVLGVVLVGLFLNAVAQSAAFTHRSHDRDNHL
jgi:hypothetical protein